ncbi:hypothetical protein SARC_13084, partial [Sphaeroforma arctica JP610]
CLVVNTAAIPGDITEAHKKAGGKVLEADSTTDRLHAIPSSPQNSVSGAQTAHCTDEAGSDSDDGPPPLKPPHMKPPPRAPEEDMGRSTRNSQADQCTEQLVREPDDVPPVAVPIYDRVGEGYKSLCDVSGAVGDKKLSVGSPGGTKKQHKHRHGPPKLVSLADIQAVVQDTHRELQGGVGDFRTKEVSADQSQTKKHRVKATIDIQDLAARTHKKLSDDYAGDSGPIDNEEKPPPAIPLSDVPES